MTTRIVCACARFTVLLCRSFIVFVYRFSFCFCFCFRVSTVQPMREIGIRAVNENMWHDTLLKLSTEFSSCFHLCCAATRTHKHTQTHATHWLRDDSIFAWKWQESTFHVTIASVCIVIVSTAADGDEASVWVYRNQCECAMSYGFKLNRLRSQHAMPWHCRTLYITHADVYLENESS